MEQAIDLAPWAVVAALFIALALHKDRGGGNDGGTSDSGWGWFGGCSDSDGGDGGG